MSETAALDRYRALADLVAENPARAAVLDRLGLDFCCHGQRPLDEACQASGLDVDQVAAALDTVADATREGWTGGDHRALAAYVEDVHHGYLHQELPAVQQLAEKVFLVHGDRHPELHEVRDLVEAIVAALVPHLAAEEQDVFPVIEQLAPGAAGDGRLSARIASLVEEHAVLGEQLARLREVTGQYAAPSDACASYSSLYARLAALEADTHVHIHLENNVLFPAVSAGA